MGNLGGLWFVVALVLFGLMVAVMLLAADVALGAGADPAHSAYSPYPPPTLLTLNPYFDAGLDYWTYNQGVVLCDASDPDAPCVRLRQFGEIQQAFESPGYGTLYVTANARQTTCPTNTVYIQLCLENAQYGRMSWVWPLPYNGMSEYPAQYDQMPSGTYTMYARYYGAGCVSGEIILTDAGAFWWAGAAPQETATPRPTPTRLVPPSPTPRATVATPIGASNLRDHLTRRDL